jgi:hypothetical protein
MKNVPLILLSLLLTSHAFGQKHIRLSFSGSPSINWMNTDNSIAQNGKTIPGYDFGLNADFYFLNDERYSLYTGLIISNIGGEIKYNNNDSFNFSGKTLPGASNIEYRLRYVEVPLALRLRTDQFKYVSYWGLFGFSNMFNIESKGKSDDRLLRKTDIGDEVGLFNLAMNIGAGIDFDLGGSNTISTGIVFQNGLLDVTTNTAFSDKTILNSVKLKIGVIF